jgi:hypothetical protein
MIELNRTDLLRSLEHMAQSGSLLVVGGPGAGKSWLLRRFAAQREEAGDAAPLILAEEHNYVESLSQLDDSLKTPAGIIPTLKAYPGAQKFLVIDSLDALRAEASQRVFRQLIRRIHRELPEWKVVASIRSFDAKESLELQELFPPSSGEFTILNARHITVPIFTDLEIEEAKQQDIRLKPIFESASVALREVLRNAFNLWLVIHLLDEKVGVDWLYEIESEVQLFERYWHYRIASRADSYDRISILTDVTSEMVNSRTLSISFGNAYKQKGASGTFRSLLSDEVLRTTQTQRVAYGHNILFDFAVSKLLLDEERLFPFLVDPNRSIFFRPSVSHFLALLWYRDRAAFWSVISRFFAPDHVLPARLHVLPGMTIFSSATSVQEFEPLLALPDSVGVNTILSVLRAVQAFGGITSRRSRLWLYLICELSNRLDVAFLNEYLALIDAASQEAFWTRDERGKLASASIQLLKWMWSQAKSNESAHAASQLLDLAAGRVIPIVTRFYRVDPDHVRATLRLVLDRIGRPDVSANEAYWLANSLEVVIDTDPAFAVDVYEAIFAHEEKSKKRTQIGGSKVLVLTSTRAQDYSMAYHILGVRLNQFIERDLNYAALAALRSVSGQVRREHAKTARKIGKYSTRFTYNGVRSRLVADRSEIWDQGYRDNIPLQMLDAVLNRIAERLRSRDLAEGVAWTIFQSIARENQFPVVWKRLIAHTSRSPELLPFVVPLVQSPEILAAPETTVLAGDLLTRCFKDLSHEDKQKIETAIWAIPDLQLAKVYREPVRQRDRLLACIPQEELSPRSKAALEAATSAATLMKNEPYFKLGSVSQVQFTEDDWLRQQGADPDTDSNRQLLDVKKPLAAFESRYLNDTPSTEEVEAILPALRIAFERLTATPGADQHVITDLFTSVAAVAESIVKNNKLDPEGAAVRLCRDITAAAAVYPHPEVHDKADDNFDTPMWSPTPKIEAAQAVTHVAYNWGPDQGIQLLMEQLSTDKSPAVRFQIATGLGSLYKPNPQLFWQIAHRMRKTEKATGVLVALAGMVGHAYIAKSEPQRVVKWWNELLRKRLLKRRPEDLLQVILDSLMYLYICVNEPTANDLIRSLEKSPLRYARHLHIAASSASYYLTYNIDQADSAADSIRARAREIELRVLRAVDLGLQSLEDPISQTKRGAKGREESANQLLMAVDTLAFRLYILINANAQLARPEDKPLPDDAVRAFFRESVELWDSIVSADTGYRRPMGPSTAHHLMESFNHLLAVDPDHILKLTRCLITGRTLGYEFDQMAIGEFVKFAEKLMADHRELLRDETNAVRFAEILDVFVRAGWPVATQIVLRMDAAVR